MLTFVAGQVRKAAQQVAGEARVTGFAALDAVHLMTIHRAKGLEWRAVFVVGFAMNLLPHHRSLRYIDGTLLPASVEEERRLAYVAITRAREFFSLSWPQYHNSKSLGPSPFLDEMPTLAPQIEAALHTPPPADDEGDDEEDDDL